MAAGRGPGGGRPQGRQGVPGGVPVAQPPFQFAAGVDGGGHEAVAEEQPLADRPVEHRAYLSAHHDRDGDDGVQPFGGDRAVVLVADRTGHRVVVDPYRQSQREGLAAEAGSGLDGQPAQRPGGGAGQLGDGHPGRPAGLDQAAERHRQAGAAQQVQQGAADLVAVVVRVQRLQRPHLPGGPASAATPVRGW